MGLGGPYVGFELENAFLAPTLYLITGIHGTKLQGLQSFFTGAGAILSVPAL